MAGNTVITLVAGPPCSGKTTYVRQRCTPTDVVLDFDLIAVSLGSDRMWRHHAEIAQQAEYFMTVYIARLAEKPQPAWVVRCLPEQAAREQLAQQLNATVVLLNPGIDVCIHRAKADGRPAGTIKAIRRWYQRHG